MQKDLKIGMISGVVLVIGALVYISTKPSLTTKARMLKANQLNETEYIFDDEEPVEIYTPPVEPETVASIEVEPPKVLPKPEPAERIKTQRFHIIRRNETLSNISYKYYGSASKWSKIFRANRNVLTSPNKIKPGTKLIIPD